LFLLSLPLFAAACCTGDGERDIMSVLHALIRDCTQHNPEQRPSMRVVLDRVRHVQKMYEDMRLAATAAAAAAPGSHAYAASAAGSASEAGSLGGVMLGSRGGSPGVE
jgi:hypothetical protein